MATLDGFVRAAGAAMGMARESFGTGGGVALAPPPVLGPPPDQSGDGSGAAADGFSHDSTTVTNHVGALGDHDAVGHSGLQAAVASSGASRGRMDSVIAAAVADVQATGVAVNTPAGQQALVAAIKRHLEDTKSTLDQGSGDAATHAASANVTAAGYQGIGSPQGGAPPMMPMMPQLPMGGGLPMGGAGGLLGPLGSLGSLLGHGFSPQTATGADVGAGAAGTSALGEPNATSAAAISTGEVNLRKEGFPAGPQAYRQYLGKTFDLMGITDPVARARSRPRRRHLPLLFARHARRRHRQVHRPPHGLRRRPSPLHRPVRQAP